MNKIQKNMIDLKSGNFYLIKHLSDDKTDIMNVAIVKDNFIFFTLLSDNIYQRISIDDFNNKFKLIDSKLPIHAR